MLLLSTQHIETAEEEITDRTFKISIMSQTVAPKNSVFESNYEIREREDRESGTVLIVVAFLCNVIFVQK